MQCALLAAGSVCEVTQLVIDETVRNKSILSYNNDCIIILFLPFSLPLPSG